MLDSAERSPRRGVQRRDWEGAVALPRRLSAVLLWRLASEPPRNFRCIQIEDVLTPTVSIAGSAILTNVAGLHARPAVKLTTLAKQFVASIELAKALEGPWFDAKSPVRVMRLKAPKGTTLFFGQAEKTRRLPSRRKQNSSTKAFVKRKLKLTSARLMVGDS